VSFNRPYAAGYGSGGFLTNDAGIVQLAERTGNALAYATDYDVARDPALASGAAAVLIGGNSEFWTSSLRNTVRAAVASGTNLALFGAGTGSRQVRLLVNGRALEVSGAKPSASVRLTGQRPSCPAAGTVSAAGPASDRRSRSGAGSGTKASKKVSARPSGWTVSNANWWGYRGAEVRTGEVLRGLVAGAADRAATSSPASPMPMQVVSFNRILCGTKAAVQSAVYQVRTSGAGVFATGTGHWVCVVTDSCQDVKGRPVPSDSRARQVVLVVTRNVIDAFDKARSGERYPARESASSYASLR
jgi:hypothetical protein